MTCIISIVGSQRVHIVLVIGWCLSQAGFVFIYDVKSLSNSDINECVSV